MFICKICGSEVHRGQAFCLKCGADVVENYDTICSACGSKNAAGSRYCAKCGGILPVMTKPICAVCGAKNLPGAKFCVSCGAPLAVSKETHADSDMLDARKTKLKIDTMQRERMAAVDKEISEIRKKVAEEKDAAWQEVEDYRTATEKQISDEKKLLNAYREKLNELGSEDVAALKKMSKALKDYSAYYADPYSMMDEDDIDAEVFVCPACGTVNPLDVVQCSHCGRNKARSVLLLAKGKIKQSPPIKRKKPIIAAPEEDLTAEKTPTLEEFAAEEEARMAAEADAQEQTAPVEEENTAGEKEEETKDDAPEDFSGRANPYAGYPPYAPYPYPPYPYPYPPYQFAFTNQQNAVPEVKPEPYQMPPIVQPVAFVPYLTQDQPLLQQEQPSVKKK